MFQQQPIYSRRHEPERLRYASPSDVWSIRRKLLVILIASLVAWILWGGAGLLIWRALQF
jgi:hypothetical protein